MDPRLLVAQLEEFREALEGINANVSPPPNPRLGPRVALPSLLPRPVFSNRVADRPPRARPLFPPRSVQQLQRAEDEFAKHAAEDAKERDAFSATRDRELRDAVASVEAASVALDADAEAGHARLVEHLDRLREDFTRSAAKGAAALLAHAGEISALSDAHAEFVKRVEAETAYQRVASAWPAEAARDFVEDAEAHRRMATLRVSARVGGGARGAARDASGEVRGDVRGARGVARDGAGGTRGEDVRDEGEDREVRREARHRQRREGSEETAVTSSTRVY
jgi:hypothetical protein